MSFLPGLRFRKTIRLDGRTWVNVSKTGPSVSRRIGDRVTVNSRGHVTDVQVAREDAAA